MQISHEQNKAASEIVDLIAAQLGDKNGAVHPATVITASARLAGSFLFRSFDFPNQNISPGTPVLSEIANEKGSALIGVLSSMLNHFGVDIDSSSLKQAQKGESKLGFLETLKILQDKALVIMENNQLNFEQMAYACSMATAFLIKECKSELSLESGFNTAIYGFIEGTKTFPPELKG